MQEIVNEIGIVDTREVITFLQEKFNLDFKDYALTAFKHRLELFMHYKNIKNTDILIQKLTKNEIHLDTFLTDISVEETEMFRDPSLWRIIKNDILPEQAKIKQPVICLPLSVSGDELFTLAIVIKEAGLDKQFEIKTSYLTDIMKKNIESGKMDAKKIEISELNYNRYQGASSLNAYYTIKNQNPARDISLLKNVTLFKQNINFDSLPEKNNLILFRNQMIYYNLGRKDKILTLLDQTLMSGGYLIIGARENLKGHSIEDKYILYSESESIYKKK
jgi:chemotaxis protein methyltransferase CheR